jgi:hypothetical protein
MRADHYASSGASRREHEFQGPPREPVRDLRPLVDDVLRTAVAVMREGVARATIADLDPMRELCAAARARDVRAETLILALKDAWRRLPDTHGANRLEADAMLATVITRCIREYYGPRRA